MTSNPSSQATHTTDPFQVLRNYYQALGGFEKFRSEITSYSAGEITIVGTGMKGSFRQWTRAPLLKRTELDINAFKQISGDDGKRSWVIDPNGKLIILTDEITSKRREITALREVFKHLDPFSDQFEVRYEGIQQVDEKSCYVLQISNKINDDVEIDFFDVNNYLLVKTIEVQPEQEKSIVYSDYREVEGVKHPFKQETEVLPVGQKQLLEINEYQSNVRIDDSLFQPPESTLKNFEFLRESSEVEIDFDFVDNHLIIPVVIEGTIRHWVIDSTAALSSIDWGYAQELELKLEENIEGEDQRIEFSLAALPVMQLKELKFRNLRVAVTVVSQVFKRIIGIEIAGVLGVDFLSNFVVKVDYSSQKIILYEPESFEYSGAGKSIDTEFINNMIIVPAKVDNTFNGNWKLDIGASRISLLHAFAKTNNLLEKDGINIVGYGMGSETTGHLSQFSSFEIGGFEISKPIIHIHHKYTDELLTQSGIIGIFGNSLLRNFVLFVDYKKQKVLLEKGSLFNELEPLNKCGLQILNSEVDEITVQYISSGTVADEAGFQKNDIIRSVNGIDLEFLAGLQALRCMLKGAENKVFEFIVTRGDNELEFKMELNS